MKYTKQHRRSKRMNLYEISTDFYSVECKKTTTISFSMGRIPIFMSHIKNHYLYEINDVKIITDGRHYSVVFLDEKMKQRYFNLVKKIASDYIEYDIAELQSRKTLIQNSEIK